VLYLLIERRIVFEKIRCKQGGPTCDRAKEEQENKGKLKNARERRPTRVAMGKPPLWRTLQQPKKEPRVQEVATACQLLSPFQPQ